jgi:hypothetical protein
MRRNLLVECIFFEPAAWRFEYISSLKLLSHLLSVTDSH